MKGMLPQYALLLALISWLNGQELCPSECVCYSATVQCPPGTVSRIPNIESQSFGILDLSGNQFASPVLKQSNFSQWTELSELKLKGCGIEAVTPNTFAVLLKLKLLDLSGNNMRLIGDGTFRGLMNLDYLFIGDNPNLQLTATSFQGMQTEILNLEKSSLKTIEKAALTPLTNRLRKLYLNGNDIEILDPNLRSIFMALESLRIEGNPLKCDCNARWLKQFYDSVSHETIIRDSSQGTTQEPRCSSPLAASGSFFNQLSISDFVCQSPMIEASISFASNQATLKCKATGIPAPSITWHRPNGISKQKHPNDTHEMFTAVELVLTTEITTEGQYDCIASNSAGNSSVSINVEWPMPNTDLTRQPCNTQQSQEVVITGHPITDKTEPNVFFVDYFSLLDLIGAVVGTFASTLIICVVILHFCVYKRKKSSHHYASSPSNSDYSASSLTHTPHLVHTPNTQQRLSHANINIQNRPLPKIYEHNHYMTTEIPDEHDHDGGVSFHMQGHPNRMSPYAPPCDICRYSSTMHS